ncbi:Uracil DNA glycosylase superfamily protein [uncultured archaeon]|nr:Uracil DNA glycosylase superfamily protein [uncultured archaeon]
MDKQPQLRALEKEISDFVVRRTSKAPVPGEGSASAPVFFVGEAAGANEERTGRPFVGRAGKLLTGLIENQLHMRREQVYITSVVKWRPPDNRKPLKDEIEACMPFLNRQLDLIQPKLIVLLGNTALNSVLDHDMKIGAVHGRIIEKEGRRYFPTYHPAAGLRATRWKKALEQDFVQLALELEK